MRLTDVPHRWVMAVLRRYLNSCRMGSNTARMKNPAVSNHFYENLVALPPVVFFLLNFTF